MPQGRAVTHADLEPSPSSTDLGSKTGVILIVLMILVGVFCFVLCLFAEATRSQVTWIASYRKEDGESYQCVYSGSGKIPLLCGAMAFVGLAVAMVVEHIYMLLAVTKSPPPVLLTWDTNSGFAKILTWTASFFFVSTWLCFAVGEVLLLIAISVESGHLTNWSKPRPNCLIIKEGLLSAAGVFSLLTVSLATGLYLTALHAQRVSKEHEILRQQILYTSSLYASPPRTPPPRRIMATHREDPVGGDNDNHRVQDAMSFANAPGFAEYLKYAV